MRVDYATNSNHPKQIMLYGKINKLTFHSIKNNLKSAKMD